MKRRSRLKRRTWKCKVPVAPARWLHPGTFWLPQLYPKRVKMKTNKIIHENETNNAETETELTIDEQIDQLAAIIINHLLKQLYEN